jgi:ABC-type transport system involved in multi-copper enzyme maturation permease subunit
MVFVTVATTLAATESLSREVRKGTLGLLVLTPLSGWRIALGKWMGSMAHALLLVLAGTPVLAIAVFLGGVGPLEVAWGTSLSLALAAVSAGFAILHVATFPVRHNALVGALFTVFLYVLAPTVFAIMGAPGMTIAAYLSPPHAAVAAAIAHTDADWGAFYRWGWAGATLTSLLTAQRLLQASAGHLQRWTPEGSALVPSFEAASPVQRPTRTVSEDRPLVWKELLLREAAWGGSEKKALLVAGVAALGILCWLPGLGKESGPLLFLGLVFSFLAVLNGAALFLAEKDARAWDPLLATPVARAAIVRAKLLAGLAAPESRAGLALALLAAAGWGHPGGLGGILLHAAVGGLFLSFSYLLGAAAALRTRSMRGAFGLSSGVLAVLLFVLPWLTGRTTLVDRILRSLHPASFLDEPSGAALPHLVLYLAVYGAACLALYAGLVRSVDRIPSRAG